MRPFIITRLFLATLACGLLPCGAFGADAAPSGQVLRNQPLPGGTPLLPLPSNRLKKVIVVGPGLTPGASGQAAPAPSALLAAIRERGKQDGFQVVQESWSATAFTPVGGAALTPDEKTPSVPGLKGEYFENLNLEGKPAMERIDEPRFDSEAKAPGPRLKPGGFSVRWTGFIKPPAPGKYRIRLCGEGKARAWIKDQLVYDGWDKDPKKGGMGEFTNVPEFRQNELFPVRIEYRNQGPLQLGMHWMSFVKKEFSEFKTSDAVILIMGGDSEGAKEQEEFLAAAAPVNPVTVAVFPSVPPGRDGPPGRPANSVPSPGRDGPPGRPTLSSASVAPGLTWALDHVSAVLQQGAENDANTLCNKLFSKEPKKTLP